MRILITGGGGAGCEAIWRYLGHKYELHFADADVRNINPIISKERRHQIPFASSPDFVSKVSNLLRDLKIDLLVPCVDEELLLLKKNETSFAPTRVLLPEFEYIEKMLDKFEMANSLLQRGLPVPRTRLLGPGNSEEFPLIVKPRKGRGSRGVSVVANQAEKERLVSALKEGAKDYVEQERVSGIEYTVQMIADQKGELRAIVPVRVDLKRGITIRAATDRCPEVMAACERIHEQYPCAGTYNVQLMLTADKKVFPFEINPRISTTFCLVVAAGIDPFEVYMGTQSKGILPFKDQLVLERHWNNIFS